MFSAIGPILKRFLNARAGGRRFHAQEIGAVDPHKCFADFLVGVASNDRARLEKTYGSHVEKAAMTETGGGVGGGYLVPQELRHDLMLDVADRSIFRGHGAWVLPMNTATLALPMPDASVAVSQGTAPFWGGLLLAWMNESQSRTQTQIAWRQLELTTHNLGGSLRLSLPLTQDGGPTLEAALLHLFASSIAWYEDYFFLSGTGVGQPTGVLNAGCALSVIRGTTSKFLATDRASMLAEHWAPSGERCWALSQTAAGQLVSMTGWIPNGPMQLDGGPVLLTAKQPILGATGDVILLDPSCYVIGDRDTLVAYSGQTQAFLTYEGDWLLNHRVDGQPLLNAAISLPDSSGSSVSPFVILHS
jgi:HK97 family phage major capsid protein